MVGGKIQKGHGIAFQVDLLRKLYQQGAAGVG
jgi:hypothetical protein